MLNQFFKLVNERKIKVEIGLEFAPAALEATGVEPGDFLGDNLLVGLKEIDNEAGILILALALC